jgi:allantoicase
MHDQHHAATFTGLVDLVAESMGGAALATSDDFFAGMENLVKPGRGVFLPDEYTDRGKWMDGWESRRKRTTGHDWCLLRLGARGVVRGLDIDTNHFLGNHPPYASVEATEAPRDATADALAQAAWTEILPPSPLRPGSQNLFAVQDTRAYSHVRLSIYPDGGVARLRVYGDVVPDWSRRELDAMVEPQLQKDEVDLVAVQHGGLALACSDSFFGPMNNLIAPGRAENMGGGWETRRRRGPGHDWILLRLGARGAVGLVEVDTNHFKGNYPDRFRLDGIDAGLDARIPDLIANDEFQEILPETRVTASHRHFFRDEVAAHGPFTHVRLTIFPDGGVSRLRLYGRRALDDGAAR